MTPPVILTRTDLKNMKTSKREYKQYIQSEGWQKVRQRYFKSKLWKQLNKKCYACKKESKVDLHHKTYKCLGNESLNYLLPLCRSCHELVHRLVKSEQFKTTLWSGAQRLQKLFNCKNRRLDCLQREFLGICINKSKKIKPNFHVSKSTKHEIALNNRNVISQLPSSEFAKIEKKELNKLLKGFAGRTYLKN